MRDWQLFPHDMMQTGTEHRQTVKKTLKNISTLKVLPHHKIYSRAALAQTITFPGKDLGTKLLKRVVIIFHSCSFLLPAVN